MYLCENFFFLKLKKKKKKKKNGEMQHSLKNEKNEKKKIS